MPEQKAGNSTACGRCHARTGRSPGNYGCDTDLLDGKKYNQPYFCPLPRIVYSAVASRIDPYQVAGNLVGDLKRSGKLK
jgi:hypothetical protein